MSALAATPQAVAAAPDEAKRLLDLYATYKGLVLSVGATLAMGQRAEGADGAARALLAGCEHAAQGAGPALGEQFAACLEAAQGLVGLTTSPGDGQGLEVVRRQHRRLRRLVWDAVGCEYAPCGSTAPAVGALGDISGRSEQ